MLQKLFNTKTPAHADMVTNIVAQTHINIINT